MTALAEMEPIRLEDLKKGIVIPEEDFERFLQRFDWTWHQVARGEFPPPFRSLEEFQLACLCADPVLWCRAFLRDPDEPDEPWQFWDYQKESIRYPGHTIHECGAEVGKTREIIGYTLWKAFTEPMGSGLITAPMAIHYIEIIDAIEAQLSYNPELGRALVRHRKAPHHQMRFSNGFVIDFRPTGHDGEALRGVHAKTFCIMDEAVKAKNPDIFKEFWRAGKPSCVFKLYSVPDGDRSCVFYKLCKMAEGEEVDDEGSIFGNRKAIVFRKFHWSKELMPPPFWSPERKRFYIDLYGGEDSPGYQQNVKGNWGDPENSVFPWHQFQRVVKDIPEYRCLKILVDNTEAVAILRGTCYRLPAAEEALRPEMLKPKEVVLLEREVPLGRFDIRQEVKSFFSNIPGLKAGGADLGFSQDPTEIYVKLILGRTHRLVARLQLKGVTYDLQAEAIDALDDIFDAGQLQMPWGVDFGNAGSAVVHILQGQEQYLEKRYEDRLFGYQFGSTCEAVDEDGNIIIDQRTQKPVKVTVKELATDLLVKKMQRGELEYPYDPDLLIFYPNHTYRQGSHHRIFKKEDDHVIDADRALTLRLVLEGEAGEDIFSVGAGY